MKTKAIVFSAAFKAEIVELELPGMTDADILVETQVSAISVGTERWAYIGKRAEIGFPSVPGYMGIGKILQMGKDAASRGYNVGDLVNFSTSNLPAGYNETWMGTHLSHAVVDVCNDVDWVEGGFNCIRCEKVPEDCLSEDVALTQLCAVAMRGIEMAGIPAASKVLVNGLGIIGQFAVQVCRLKGAYVAAADVDETRLALAKDYGADWTINASSQDVLAEADKITGGEGFDIIIDTSSIPAVVNQIFPALKLFGKFIFQGWYPPPSSLDLNTFHAKLPTCYFPCAHTGRATMTAMRWTASGKLDSRKMITHCVKPEAASEMYQMIEQNNEPFLGILFDWRNN
jgi:2-desacetyl-2-hydroxyethyl bacteriochlorophyllide A dehydrogenase